MIVFEIVGGIIAGVAFLTWVVVKLTRGLWAAAWRRLQEENQEAERLHRIELEARELRRRNEERQSANHAAAQQELEACLNTETVEHERGDAAPETATGRAEQPCQEHQENLVDPS